MKELFDGAGTMDERIEQLAQQYADSTVVMSMVEFARGKERFGLCQPDSKKAA
jgi:acyl-[acyl carrier protein]--UDP-N-acetylglucosamine O-acyltransferase